jgi:hypothetical protein
MTLIQFHFKTHSRAPCRRCISPIHILLTGFPLAKPQANSEKTSSSRHIILRGKAQAYLLSTQRSVDLRTKPNTVHLGTSINTCTRNKGKKWTLSVRSSPFQSKTSCCWIISLSAIAYIYIYIYGKNRTKCAQWPYSPPFKYQDYSDSKLLTKQAKRIKLHIKNTYMLSYFSTLSQLELKHLYRGISFCMNVSMKYATCELSHVVHCETLKKLSGMLTSGVKLLHDNARPNTAARTPQL